MDDVATRYIGLLLAVALAATPMTSYFARQATSGAILRQTTDAAVSTNNVNGANSMCNPFNSNPIHAAIQNCGVLPLIGNEQMLTFEQLLQ
jgi:hypothetical protein